MISHEKRLSRQMIQHFSKIEESIITYYAWKFESPMWPMIVRCPFTNFSEFGEDWADKCERSWEFRIYSKSIVSVNTYSPMKFSPTKKPDDEDMRDELGRPIVPQNQTSRTLRIFLKRVSCACRRASISIYNFPDVFHRRPSPSRAHGSCFNGNTWQITVLVTIRLSSSKRHSRFHGSSHRSDNPLLRFCDTSNQ